MRPNNAIADMMDTLSELYLATANEEYRAFLGTTIEALDWVLGE